MIPNAELALVGGARTFSPVDQPDQVAGLILQFLRRTRSTDLPASSAAAGPLDAAGARLAGE